MKDHAAMGSQPNLAVGRKWCRFTNAPPQKKNEGPLPRIWAAKIKLLATFCDFLTQPRISPERNVASTNQNASVNLQCPQQLTYFSRPLTQKRLRSVPSFWPTIWKFSIYRHFRVSHTKAT